MIRKRRPGVGVAFGLGAAALALGSWAMAATENVGATLIAMEKASWVAWQKHDTKFYQGFLSDDHVEVGFGGPDNKANVIKGVESGCTVKSYDTKGYKVTQLGPETALITYWATQDTLCGGQPVPTPVWVSSLYVKRKGKWLNAVYQQSAIPGPAKP
jgi:hypothetical protein